MVIGTRRSDLEIIADILRIGGTKTAIMYGSNLSYQQTLKYIDTLTGNGLLVSGANRSGRREYRTTEKGKHFLNLFQEVEKLTAELA